MESNRELENIYCEVMPRVNPFTPVILEYIKVDNNICEISTSHKDIRSTERLYGVSTITKQENGEYEYNSKLSMAFDTIENAYEFIKTIKNGINR